MNHHEREFFIYTIRSGKVLIKDKNIKLEILPPSINLILESCHIYKEVYDNSFVDGMMTEYELHKWMDENGLWTIEHEKTTDRLKKDLEKLKTEIYNYRNEFKVREKIRRYIRAAEKQYAEHVKEKNSYFQHTREGYALSEKISWLIKHSTYQNNELYDFKDISLSYVIDEWQNSILSDSVIRELAREEPWKSLWSVKDSANIKLFNIQGDIELTTNQKNLLVWSQIYDNIQESMDCPHEDVIKDDDLLDGWLIIQSEKRKKEKLEQEFESDVKNDKIKNSQEVFIITNDNQNKERINSLNSPMAQIIKKQRYEAIKQKGSLKQEELPDEKLRLEMEVNNFINQNRRGG